jgi:elongation factor Ts
MAYSATDVKNLREQTGAGMMDCKKALDEVSGDFQKAVDYLRTKGLAAAAKKQSRVATEGMIAAAVGAKTGVVVEINSETDFAGKSPDFVSFVTATAKTALENNITTVDGLLNAKSGATTVKDMISELTIKIGEKIDVRRVEAVKLAGHGIIGNYVHSGKIGVLVVIESDKDVSANDAVKELAKDLCMHVAAASPQFLSGSEIDESFKSREAEVYAAQLKEQGKPEAMIPNIVKGKLAKLASDVCLMEQAFVKDPDTTIAKLVETVGKTAGAQLKVTKFVKLVLGEGLQKKEDNFAEEVAKMTGHN